MSKTSITVTVESSLNCDGFSAIIKNGDEILHERQYRYGYNCSWDKGLADAKQPYVTDVLQNLIDQYHVDEFSVEAGRNVFAGKPVSSDQVERFENKYCADLQLQTPHDYRVYIGETPVTVSITDKKRADLAFCMLSLMNDNGVGFQKDGKDIERGQQGIRIVDRDGNNVEPELDKEWYGDLEGKNSTKDAVLDKIIADMIAEGAEPNREFEAELMDEYTVCTYDEDKISVRFAPMTWDINKANEMVNMINYGIDPSIVMMFNGHVINDDARIINYDGDVYKDTPNENWAKEIVDDGQDFADAVANIPVDDKGLAQ